MINPKEISELDGKDYVDSLFREKFHDRLDPSWLLTEEAEKARLYFHEGWNAYQEIHA